ncbi:P450 monooxygenase [Colletotrichum salicis]|uniref:p450 monooxygenase n=1 Tax=Colletotrichum salicis TaxID=1209931 RepID=A0A135V555_9PEZI|nr:P450 monooxygenase [Colletotrichum salicis]
MGIILQRLADYHPWDQLGKSTTLVLFSLCALGLLAWHFREDKPYSGFKLVGKERGEWSYEKAKEKWNNNAFGLLRAGFEETHGRPFQVLSPLVMLPPSLCDEIRNDKRLTFTGFIDRQWRTRYPGLDILQDGLSHEPLGWWTGRGVQSS